MKKLVVTLALLGAVASSYAQGVVGTGNSAALASIKPADGPAVLMPAFNTSGSAFTFALLVAPSTATGVIPLTSGTAAAWDITKASLAGYTVAGYGTNAGTAAGRIIFTPATFPIADYAAGSTVSLMMVGYNGRGTYANALQNAEWVGTSDYGRVILGGGAISTPSFFGNTQGGATLDQSAAFTIFQVPEPTSMALAGLGAAALLIFRRRS